MNILRTFSTRSVFMLGSLGALTVAANAQSAVATAKVPFEFIASGAVLPQGEYTVDVPDLSGVIVLRGSSGNSVALLATVSGTTRSVASAKLIFQRLDGMPYLSAVEWPNQSAIVLSPYKRITKGAVATALR
jgi:hypothetical protein